MKRLLLIMILLAASIQVEAAKMSSYTNNTTPNGDVYFVGVDPNDISQTANGSNYRYSLNSILNLGLLDAVFNSLSIAGTGDSWIELENNTSFSDSIAGKYGLRFYNGALQQIINGTASSIGSGGSAPTIQSDDPTIGSTTGWYLAKTSGDLFYVNHGIEMFAFAGTRTADETDPVLVAAADSTHDGATAVSGSVVLTEDYPASPAVTYSATNATPASGNCTGAYPNYVTPDLTPTGTSDIVVTYAATDLAGNAATGTDLVQTLVYTAGTILTETFEGTGYSSPTWTEVREESQGTINEDYTAEPLVGSDSLYIQAITYRDATTTKIVSVAGDFSLSFVYRPLAFVTSTAPLISFINTSTAVVRVDNRTGGHLGFIHGATSLFTSTALSSATTYKIWIDYVKGTGTDGTMSYYVAEGANPSKPGSPTRTLTGGTNQLDITSIRITGDNACEFIIDEVIVE